VLDWFGEWSESALFQVGQEFTKTTDISNPAMPDEDDGGAYREAVVRSMVHIHNSITEANKALAKQGRMNYVTPRNFYFSDFPF